MKFEKTETEKARETLNAWMRDFYPHNKWVQTLSFKWVVIFAIYYKNLKK